METDPFEQRYAKKWYQQRYEKANRICNILNSVKNHSNPLIVDVGCHEGDMEELFAKFTNDFVVGIDISYDSLRRAKNKINQNYKIEFIQASANALPIRKTKIDWIICNYVIDYLEIKDREKVINEFELLLKNDGLVYLSVGNSLFLKLFKIFPSLFTPFVGEYFGKQHTGSKSYASPMNYEYWKKVVHGKVLEITDITSDLISEEISKKTKNQILAKFIKNLTKRCYRLFLNLSPTWIFILQRKAT